jgi:hypothetical protein
MRARGARHPVGDLLHLSDQLLDAAEHQVEILSELIRCRFVKLTSKSESNF